MLSSLLRMCSAYESDAIQHLFIPLLLLANRQRQGLMLDSSAITVTAWRGIHVGDKGCDPSSKGFLSWPFLKLRLLFILGLVYSKARGVEDVKRGRNVWGFYGRRTVGKLAGSEGY